MGRDDFLSDLIVTHSQRWDLEGMTLGLSGKLGTLKYLLVEYHVSCYNVHH